MKIEITALDTLFFRDGKPFSMGEDTWATGVFPPYPSVLYGMLRSAYASQNNINIKDIIYETQSLKIKSIFLKYEKHYIFPYPADLFTTTGLMRDNKAEILKIVKNKNISSLSNKDFQYLLSTENTEKVKDFFGKAFLSNEFSKFLNYLNAINNPYKFLKYNDILFSESKIGIGKDTQRNITSEGKLYRVGMQRLEDDKGKKITIEVEFEGLEKLNFAEKGFLKFGAENKIAFYQKVENNLDLKAKIKDNFVKIYLTTPAIFENGFVPKFIVNKKIDNIEFELITMAIGKPIFIGGFDMQANKGKGYPKPMRKAVPAGSVYYLRTNKAQELVNKLHGNSISEELSEQGFGICYCGTFNM